MNKSGFQVLGILKGGGMMNAALKDSDWIEEESFLAEHWDEMTIDNPAIPVAGIWKENIYICFYCDHATTPTGQR